MAKRPRRRAVRVGAGLVAACCVLVLVGSALATPASTTPAVTPTEPAVASPEPPGAGTPPASGPAAESVTVVTTQGFYTGIRPGDRDVAKLVAFDRAGEVVYLNRSYQAYFDVDPVPGTRWTVEYVAAEHLGGRDCADRGRCTRNVVERVNLSTGTAERVYEGITPGIDATRWHDVDRVNGTHLVVADMAADRVFVVDTRTDEVTWQWQAGEHYPPDAGGTVQDWTHLNDVEVLPDGRIMASVRNMDEVVFVDPGTGVQAAWTLGDDDDHDTLFEPHNPDYLPADRGGPAVVVADSENNRVVEFRREDGAWTRTWSWRDPTLQWPRDADRLPDGGTLVVDSHGDRVLEVDAAGRVVWSVRVGMAYDAERLGTGDESAAGYAAGTNAVVDGVAVAAPPAERQGAAGRSVVVALKDALPSVLLNSLLYVAPPWVGFTDLLVAGALLVDLLVWGGLEWWWSARSVRGWLQAVHGPGR